MKEILVLVPSRSSDGKRIPSLTRLVESWKKTTNGFSDFLLGIDENDKHFYPTYENVLLEVIPEQFTLVNKLNFLSKKYLDKYKYIYFVGDDCVFKTENWETTYLEAAKDKKYVMFYPNDLLQSGKLCPHSFMSSDIIKKLGFMGPGCLIHMYVDNFWMEVGKHLNCLQYFPDVILEHMHFSNNKNTFDKIYERNESFHVRDHVSFKRYMNDDFLEDMKKLE